MVHHGSHPLFFGRVATVLETDIRSFPATWPAPRGRLMNPCPSGNVSTPPWALNSQYAGPPRNPDVKPLLGRGI